jgi:hypothetical protein
VGGIGHGGVLCSDEVGQAGGGVVRVLGGVELEDWQAACGEGLRGDRGHDVRLGDRVGEPGRVEVAVDVRNRPATGGALQDGVRVCGHDHRGVREWDESEVLGRGRLDVGDAREQAECPVEQELVMHDGLGQAEARDRGGVVAGAAEERQQRDLPRGAHVGAGNGVDEPGHELADRRVVDGGPQVSGASLQVQVDELARPEPRPTANARGRSCREGRGLASP